MTHHDSVLGPLLFVLYVNDIPDLIESNIRMFADDTKIYSVIKSFNDSLKLQRDIDYLMQWSSTWLLRFNTTKCKLMQINNSNPVSYTMVDSTTNLPVEFNVVQEEKDLGIWCTNDLKPLCNVRELQLRLCKYLGR